MNGYEAILKKVGVVLIVIGLLDISYMIYCITHEVNYSSSFNIFAIIAGIFLYKGSLKTAKIISFFSAFILTVLVGSLFIFPLFVPFDLLLTQIKLNPVSSSYYFIFIIFTILLFVWILKNLTSPIILEEMINNNINPKSLFLRPRTGIIMGIILLTTLACTLYILFNGETAEMAKNEAYKKVGNGYNLSISQINITQSFNGKTHVWALVTAYNDKEIKKIAVEFEK